MFLQRLVGVFRSGCLGEHLVRGARGFSPRGARVFLAVLSDPRPKGSGSISCAVREKRGARVILFTATFGTEARAVTRNGTPLRKTEQ